MKLLSLHHRLLALYCLSLASLTHAVEVKFEPVAYPGNASRTYLELERE
ncbi:MAG: hypothetical protein AB7S86_12020 [Hydrogenophaga sp.]